MLKISDEAPDFTLFDKNSDAQFITDCLGLGNDPWEIFPNPLFEITNIIELYYKFN